MEKMILKLFFFLIFLASFNVYSDSRRDVEFVYDGAGNLIEIKSEFVNGPPTITTITPDFFRIPNSLQSHNVTAIGSNLSGVNIAADVNNFDLIVRVNSEQINENDVAFQLLVDPNIAIGNYNLIFSNEFGDSNFPITVGPSLPFLDINVPNLTVPDPVGMEVNVSLLLGHADLIEHNFTLNTQDSDIATVSPTSITIPAGSTSPSENITLTVLATGTTFLETNSEAFGIRSVFIDIANVLACPFEPPPDDDNGMTLIAQVINRLNFLSLVLINRADTDFGIDSGFDPLIAVANDLPASKDEFLSRLDFIVFQINDVLGEPPDACFQTVIDEIEEIRFRVDPQF